MFLLFEIYIEKQYDIGIILVSAMMRKVVYINVHREFLLVKGNNGNISENGLRALYRSMF